MPLSPGTRLGSYEITSPLGVGGMGEVYRARDSKLQRDVAIKVLPDTFASDPDRLARFEREARTLATLNHPNIAAIYGLEDSGGLRALVMELVEGPTLADRIAQGPVPLDETLTIAKQIAEALEAAHEQGIVHRDLKPANIKVRPDGTVKVLDFGLAKAAEPLASVSSSVSQSPTITTPAMTQMGMILGTAAYMSPEQARGKAVDQRTDIWAFGCVLYEMLTGRRAFNAEDVSLTLAAVLTTEPNFDALPPGASIAVRQALRLCLVRDPHGRIHDMADVRLALEGAFAQPFTKASELSERGIATRERLAWFVGSILLAAATAVGSIVFLRSAGTSESPEMRLDIMTPLTPPIDAMTSMAISPDGRWIVYAGPDDGDQLWLRPIDGVSPGALPGTEGGRYPFWSYDSRSIGFFADGALKRLDIAGGDPRVLADAPAGRGGTWTQDGVILFAANGNTPLVRVSASGGNVTAVTVLREGERSHRFPAALPDGGRFVFLVTSNDGNRAIHLGSLDSDQTIPVTGADSGPQYSATGWLWFVRQDTLVAAPMDTGGRLAAEPVLVAQSVAVDGSQAAALSVSRSGAVAYRVGETALRQLTWFDRSGKRLETFGPPDATMIGVELAPNGRRAATHRVGERATDVWLIDELRATPFTSGPSRDGFPIWSPDGQSIVFSSLQSGRNNVLYSRASSGAGGEEVILDVEGIIAAHDFTSDGRYLVFFTDPADIWAVPMQGDRKPFPVASSDFNERGSQLSPDDRWIAYSSNKSGRFEVWARPFPDSIGGEWQISTGGGIQVRWRRDGREIYYLAPDGSLMAVPIAVSGNALEPGRPSTLFRPPIWGGGANFGLRTQYDVSADGRFLINASTETTAMTPITLLLNWRPPEASR